MKVKLLPIIILLLLCTNIFSQIPYAFRYQASVRNAQNRPINDEVVFDIRLFSDDRAINEVYREIHLIKPDTNGIVAFSIGKGASNDDFSNINWAKPPYYIQVLLDDQELSYSQLLSVPYALHAASASSLYDLQDPVFDNDPSTKRYVDSSYHFLMDSIAQLNKALNASLNESKAYADSLSLAPKDLEVASSGDTLQIGNKKVVIAGMSSKNSEKYPSQRCLGGSYNENISQSILCSDNNILILGTTTSGNGDITDYKGGTDIWLVKLDPNLNILWKKTFGGSLYDNASFILEEEDGYLIAGTSESKDFDLKQNHGEFDLLLIKVDINGNVIWERSYGGSSTEFINTIIKLDNDNYLIGATTFSNDNDVYWNYGNADIWIFQIDKDRGIIKERIIGGSKYDALRNINQNTDGTFTIWGTSSSNDGTISKNNGNLDLISTTLSSNFDILSHECYGTTDNEQLKKVIFGEDNTIIYGQSFSSSLSIDNTIALNNIIIESIGNNSWNKTLGGSLKDEIIDIYSNNDTLTLLAQTNSTDGDISQLKGGQDIWIIQMNNNGELLKEKCIGGTYDEYATVITPYKDGWLIGGNSSSEDQDLNINAGMLDIWIAFLDKDLNLKWQQSYGGTYNEIIEKILIHEDNSISIIGTSASNDYKISGLHDKAGESSDIWILNTTIDY